MWWRSRSPRPTTGCARFWRSAATTSYSTSPTPSGRTREPGGLMKVRFWGTRGSLPVAQKAGAIQAKIARALVAAGGHVFQDEAEAAAFAAANLDFATFGAYGGA